ncbi:N-acetyltransferase [Nocardia sp. NPDC048505]|uniref:GNAT family N-acetyltransferase n=1 Tax=unclassified Nocardia TaxID=2637762 RepID=UPI003407069B
MTEANAHSTPVLYRTPSRGDLAGIQILDGEAFPDHRYPFFVLRQLLEASSSRSFVAVRPGENHADRLVGYALCIGEGKRAWLVSLAVSSDHRGRGIGFGLLERCVQLYREQQGVDEVLLAVDPANEPAHNLFEGFGFSLVERDNRYFGDGEPRDILIYKLPRPTIT